MDPVSEFLPTAILAEKMRRDARRGKVTPYGQLIELARVTAPAGTTARELGAIFDRALRGARFYGRVGLR